MDEVEVFPRPPIVEAILSFEVTDLDDVKLAAERFYEAIHHHYPVRAALSPDEASAIFPRGRVRTINASIVSDQEGGTAHRTWRGTNTLYPADARGYSFRSNDGLQVVRVTQRGMSFHRLTPYVNWEQFEAAVRFVWREFVKSFGPDRVTRLRVRFLNRIEVPSSFTDWDEYLRLCPSVPGPIDTGLSGYLMRLVLNDPNVPAVAYVTQAVEAEVAVPYYPLIFDIDVRQEAEMLPESSDLWTAILAMREYKNRLFFESITEEMKELFR